MKNLKTRIRMKTDTTERWRQKLDFVPLKGEIIIYSDYAEKEVNGEIIKVPNFKIGDGNAYCVDLPFVDDDLRDELTAHLLDTTSHITQAEREFWNNKVRCYIATDEDADGFEVEGEELVFTTH